MTLQKNVLPTLSDFSFLLVSTAKDRQRLMEVYRSVREQYPKNEIIVVYDNNEPLYLSKEDSNLIEVSTMEKVYVSTGYNIALSKCTKSYFVFIHDDTFIAPMFLENIIPHISETTFCNFTAVEPPVFGDSTTIQKPIKDFGRTMDTFILDNFNKFAKNYIETLKEKTIASPFGGFFMAGSVKSILSIGGFDETFKPYFYEDSDLMVRLHLSGFRFVQVLDSLVYHMVSLTSRVDVDSSKIEEFTHNLFIKKWKVEFEYFKNLTMLQGIPYKNIPIKIKCINCNNQLEEYLSLYSEDSTIEVEVDGSKLSKEDLGYLQSLSYIIQDTSLEGSYSLGSLNINFS